MVAPNDRTALPGPVTRRQDGPRALKLVSIQALLVVSIAMLALLHDRDLAASAFVGGLIGLLTTGWTAMVLLRPSVGARPERLVAALYIGEFGKYLFVMAFFAIAFKKMVFAREPHNALLMIGVFAATQLAVWLWPLLASPGQQKSK